MSIVIVIGKNFGDEGKGLATDYYALKALNSGNSALVVRHNGGAQAGHTVDLKNKRFVFHQLSSGSFRGADTYWADTFLPDMYMLSDEAEGFRSLTGNVPRIFADINARCVTVIDVIINQALESLRGAGRHGSCGMGIDETVRRSKTDFAIYLRDMCSSGADGLYKRLKEIRDHYVPVRLAEMDLTSDDLGTYRDLIMDDNVLINWAGKAASNCSYIELRDNSILNDYGSIIFEGAQGLLLDEENKAFAPHLTTSRTGLANPVRMIRAVMPDKECSAVAVYVTRTYVTRHGNGPLPYECEISFPDDTNVPNEWQGKLRFAYAGPEERFLDAVNDDISSNQFKGSYQIFVTHMNEIEDFPYRADIRSYSRFAEDIP